MSARVAALVAALVLPALPAAAADTAQQITQLEAAVNAAYQANDLPTYFSYYADDFRGLFPEGVSSKADYVKSWTTFIKSGGRIEKFTYTGLVVQVSPENDAAVASYHAVATTRNPGKPPEDDKYDETDVWFERGGSWKLVEVHYSEAGKGN
jgi:ketosteroid isomerase-like protein